MALTATATHEVRRDILESLGMQRVKTFQVSFFRPNLTFKCARLLWRLEDVIDQVSNHSRSTLNLPQGHSKGLQEKRRVHAPWLPPPHAGIHHVRIVCWGMGQRIMCQAWSLGPSRDPPLSPTLGCASCATAWLPCQYPLIFIKRTSSLSLYEGARARRRASSTACPGTSPRAWPAPSASAPGSRRRITTRACRPRLACRSRTTGARARSRQAEDNGWW